MKRVYPFIFTALLFGALIHQAEAAFSTIYVFGDGISATTTAPTQTYFYGNRYSNGRVWVEVLAQRQALAMGSTNTTSYFGQDSSALVNNVTSFSPPTNVNTALFVVWVNSADFVNIINVLQPNPIVPTDMGIWTNGINQALSNHMTAIQMLYSKGVRTMLMPVGVDVTKIPYYNNIATADKAFVRQRIIEFNAGFTNMLQQAMSSLGNLTIISPNFLLLTDDILAHPTTYGLTNTTESALYDFSYFSFTNQGTNFVFWDQYHPTAKVHEILADIAHQLITPTKMTGVATLGSSNQLSVVNLPIGLGGIVESSTNCSAWSQTQSFNSSNATQVISVPVSGPMRFYRLRFPFAWSWP